jgi:DNA polymerase II large subunit
MPTHGNCNKCYKRGPLLKNCNECENDNKTGHVILVNNGKILDAIMIAEVLGKNYETAKVDRSQLQLPIFTSSAGVLDLLDCSLLK